MQALLHPADQTWTALLLLCALCGLLFFYGLPTGELYRTESLRAVIAQHFLRSGNWIVPTLYGEPLFTKPPGMYAAIALLSWPFGGVTEVTARLPSALAATGTVFLIYWYFGRQLGRRGGLLAAFLAPLNLMWLDKATAAEIDMLQVFWVTAAILCFLRALDAEDDKVTRRLSDKVTKVLSFQVAVGARSATLVPSQQPEPDRPITLSPRHPGTLSARLWWLLALLCVAGGVLTKWTAPAIFYLTVVALLWRRGQWRLLRGRDHLLSASVAAAVCLAWIAAAVSLSGWHAFYDTVSREGLMRLSPAHHERPYPWLESLLHPLRIFATNLPLSALALWTLRPGFTQLWDERGRRLLEALHCWLWPNLFFWTIIPEHATRHSFPYFPAIGGLAAMVWLAWLNGRLFWPGWNRWRPVLRPVPALLGIVACGLIAKVVFVEVVTPARNHNREPRAKGELLARLVPEGKTLYLFQLKDEGIMFYYDRTVQRLPSPAELPASPESIYCILDGTEWQRWQSSRPAKVLQRLNDEQGDPMVLLELQPGPLAVSR
jgi:4-amino-4-deoxy-L-arabinose transferase-like glycosyltransferase